MPTKSQLETALVNAHKAGDTQSATILANALKAGEWDEAQEVEQEQGVTQVQSKKTAGGMMGDALDWVKDKVSPETDGFPEMPAMYQEGTPEQALELYQRKDPSAQLSTDSKGVPVIIGKDGPMYIDQPGLTLRDIPAALGSAKDFAMETAPMLAAGGSTAAMNVLKAAPTMAAVGATSDTANQLAETGTVDWVRSLGVGAGSALGEAGARFLTSVVAPVIRRLVGSKPAAKLQVFREDGSISDDALSAIQKAGATQDDIAAGMQTELSGLKSSGSLTAEQAERYNQFIKMGMKPTKAQVTRTTDDFVNQQELLKHSGKVKSAVEAQDARASELFDDAVQKTGGNPVSAENPIAEHVKARSIELDKQVSAVYKATREAVGKEKVIRLDGALTSIKRNAHEDRGIASSLKSELKARGLIGEDGKVSGRISVEQAEDFRQYVNTFYQDAGAKGRSLIKTVKDAIDDDVGRVAGPDIYLPARKAKQQFESDLTRAKGNKFDKRRSELVRDILENKVSPETFFNDVVLAKSRRGEDLQGLKHYLTKTGGDDFAEAGAQAWNDLRAEAVDWLKLQAMKGAKGENGVPVFNGNSFRRAMDRIGTQKLKAIFDEKELGFLSDMAKIGEYRTPVPGGIDRGFGPSGYGVSQLARGVSEKVEALARFLDLEGKRFVDPANKTARALINMESIGAKRLTDTAGAASGAELAR